MGSKTIPRIGVLALQGDVREHLAAFEAAGADASPVRTAAELNDIDALALPGGESTTMSRLLEVFGLAAPLRQRLADGLPCFATCAGLILLANEIADGRPDQLALGVIDVTVQRNGFGRQVASFEAPLRIEGEDEPFAGVFIRAPRILRVGTGARVIARHGDEVVAVAQGPHLGFSFHPEMTGDLRLHRRFLAALATGSRSAA